MHEQLAIELMEDAKLLTLTQEPKTAKQGQVASPIHEVNIDYI